MPGNTQLLHILEGLTYAPSNTSGSLPAAVMGSFTNLTRLVLGSNNLTGTIPTELSDMPFLGVIDLTNNGLTGTVGPLNVWINCCPMGRKRVAKIKLVV